MARNTTTDAASAKPKKPKKEKKQRWYHQVWEVYTSVRKTQPSITWILLGIIGGVVAVGLGIGFALNSPIYAGIISLPLGVMGAMIVLARRAEKFAYERIEGQPGAVSAALGTIRRGWNIEEEPVAMDPRTQDMVFRAIGRPGVVLVSEGPPHRVKKLLEAEKRKVSRVVPNVPVVLLQQGRGEGQVPLPKLTKALRKQKKKVSSSVVPEISKRLRALQRNALPVPKGIDPLRARPDRKATRGR
ncbi:MAG: DUF4191 domain-containing protein [Beutenbergiaceae bacterium]